MAGFWLEEMENFAVICADSSARKVYYVNLFTGTALWKKGHGAERQNSLQCEHRKWNSAKELVQDSVTAVCQVSLLKEPAQDSVTAVCQVCF
jgi:hypothetical protein